MLLRNPSQLRRARKLLLCVITCVGCGGSGSSDTHTTAAPAPTEPINSEPEVPADFAGTITPSLPLTDAERVLLEQASRLHELRNPINEDPTMRGFGPATKAAQP